MSYIDETLEHRPCLRLFLLNQIPQTVISTDIKSVVATFLKELHTVHIKTSVQLKRHFDFYITMEGGDRRNLSLYAWNFVDMIKLQPENDKKAILELFPDWRQEQLKKEMAKTSW